MAWTTTKVAQYSEGNNYVQHWFLSGDSATLELSTGLKNVVHVVRSPKSMNSLNFSLKPNVNSTAVATAGMIAITGCTSGDEMYITVIGN